jgi:O-antigen/teichoic acid export membrane protein
MRQFIYYIFGLGSSKALPILYSFILANQYGHSEYNNFIQYIIYANLLSTISTVSYSPIILSIPKSPDQESNREIIVKRSYLFSTIISLLGSIISLWAIASTSIYKTEEYIESILIMSSIFLYSLGISVISIKSTKLNSQLKNKEAGLITSVTIMIPYIIGGIIIYSSYSTNPLYSFFLVSSLLLVFSLFFAKEYFQILSGSLTLIHQIKNSLPIKLDNIYLIIYSAGIMISHNFLFSFLKEHFSSEQVSTYGIGYQAFSLGIFIPGIMANFLVPRASQKKINDIKKITFYYIGFGLVWFALCIILANLMLNIYKIETTSNNLFIFLSLQATVIFCSANASINQFMAAKRQYHYMALSSIFFMGSLLIYMYIYNFNILALSLGLLFSYIIATVTTLLLLMTWKNRK